MKNLPFDGKFNPPPRKENVNNPYMYIVPLLLELPEQFLEGIQHLQDSTSPVPGKDSSVLRSHSGLHYSSV